MTQREEEINNIKICCTFFKWKYVECTYKFSPLSINLFIWIVHNDLFISISILKVFFFFSFFAKPEIVFRTSPSTFDLEMNMLNTTILLTLALSERCLFFILYLFYLLFPIFIPNFRSMCKLYRCVCYYIYTYLFSCVFSAIITLSFIFYRVKTTTLVSLFRVCYCVPVHVRFCCCIHKGGVSYFALNITNGLTRWVVPNSARESKHQYLTIHTHTHIVLQQIESDKIESKQKKVENWWLQIID